MSKRSTTESKKSEQSESKSEEKLECNYCHSKFDQRGLHNHLKYCAYRQNAGGSIESAINLILRITDITPASLLSFVWRTVIGITLVSLLQSTFLSSQGTLASAVYKTLVSS